jgi:hypothetical protein
MLLADGAEWATKNEISASEGDHEAESELDGGRRGSDRGEPRMRRYRVRAPGRTGPMVQGD